jgi:hypothetical protein
VDGEPADVLADQLAFAGVRACAHLHIELTELGADFLSGMDRARRAIERRQGPVA